MKDTTEPKVAFILVCWNNADLLEECFESIETQEYSNHVTIMIDNGSKDDSVLQTRQKFSWVDVYEARTNLGFAKGNNRAIEYALEKHSDIDYFVLLNTDARIARDWLVTLVDFALQKPKGALFQATTLDYYDHSIVDSTHIYIARNGSGTQSSWRTPFAGYKGPRKVFGVNFAAAMISSKFITAQPFKTLFDEKLFMYLEDVDVSARATIMGWDNYLVPGTLAYHMGSASSGKKPGFSLYMTYRNNIAILMKNIPLGMFIKMLPGIVRSDYHTIQHLRRHGQGDVVSKLVKGRIVGLIRLPLYASGIRRMVEYRRCVSKEYLWYLMDKGIG